MLYCLFCIAVGVLLGGEVAAVARNGLSLVLCGLLEAFIGGVPDELLESLIGVLVVDLEAGLERQEVRSKSKGGNRRLTTSRSSRTSSTSLRPSGESLLTSMGGFERM